MDKSDLEKILNLKRETRGVLANKLCYVKMIVSLLKEREISEDKIFQMIDSINSIVPLIDAKFDELITELGMK